MPGYAATKPAKGKKFDASSDAAQKYAGYLKATHDRAARPGRRHEDLRLHGRLQRLRGQADRGQAAQARSWPRACSSVEKAQNFELDTSSTPAFLGLDQPGRALGPARRRRPRAAIGSGAGEDVVIGDVDGGYWPENPAFSDRKVDGSNGQRSTRTRSPASAGICQAGENFPASTCNNKVIGARYFNAGIGVDRSTGLEFNSPRDYGGHGTHTAVDRWRATTASRRPATPRRSARSAAWRRGRASRCTRPAGSTPASTERFLQLGRHDRRDRPGRRRRRRRDQLLDRGHVGRRSRTRSRSSFLFAAAAGVFVSASAGNSGPAVVDGRAPEPVDHDRRPRARTTASARARSRSTAPPTTAARRPHAATGMLVDARRSSARCRPSRCARIGRGCASLGYADPARSPARSSSASGASTPASTRASRSSSAGGVGMILVNADARTR